MSEADELLSTLTVNSDYESYITVNDDRTITVPEELRHIAVERDHNIETVTFDCPRYWDEHDLASMCVYINYMRADGHKDSYPVHLIDPNPDDDTRFLFYWTISANVTEVKGPLMFLVYIEDSTGEHCWHSRLNHQMIVDEGLTCVEQTMILPDSIESILATNLNTQLAQVTDTIQAKADEIYIEIEAKAAAALDSIPEDYTELSNTAESNTREKASVIKMEAEGDVIVLNDSADAYLYGLNFFGKTTQIRTTGAQLAWVNINVADYPYLGVVCSQTEDGNVLLHGTSTSNMWNRLASAELTAGNTYTLSAHKDVSLSIWDVTADGAFSVKTVGQESITFTAPNSGSYSFCIENVADTSFHYIRADIMLNEGDTALPWEPYSDCIASPSPGYPQELKHVPGRYVGIYGKNLINVDLLELASNKSLTVSSDKYTVTVVGGSDNTYAYSHYDIPTELVRLVRGKTLRLSSDSVTKSHSTAYSPVQLNIKCADGTFLYPVNHTTRLYHEFYVPEDTEEIRFGIYTNNSADTLDSDNTVVATGVRLTLAEYPEYEPYKEYQTLTLAQFFPGIPVSSGGNYTDSSGQQWVCNEFNIERGVQIIRLGTTDFAGATWTENSTGKYFCNIDRGVYSKDYPIMCTHMIGGTSSSGNDENIIFINANQDIRLNITLADPSVENVATVMAGASMLGVLAQPIEAPMSWEPQALKTLRSNSPTTTILSDSGVHMAVKYAADTKTYVDNSLANGILLDTVTGTRYRIAVANGQLTLITV